MQTQPLIFCLTTYEKGQSFMRQCAAMGCRVLLLTLEKHRHADWPHDILAEVVYMPEGLNLAQITNTVTYLGRSRKFERLVALDEFDMETIAHLREHMRIPGMGLNHHPLFRDKLAMRFDAARERRASLVPDFIAVLNYDDLVPWMQRARALGAQAPHRSLRHRHS